jgi:hypothetical protein
LGAGLGLVVVIGTNVMMDDVAIEEMEVSDGKDEGERGVSGFKKLLLMNIDVEGGNAEDGLVDDEVRLDETNQINVTQAIMRPR